MAGHSVVFHVLGPVEIVHGGRSAPVDAAKQRILLAVLALRAGQRVETEELVGYLWEDEELPAQPRGAVQTYVRRLRHLLGPGILATVDGGYRLEVEPEDVDAHRFRRLVARAREQADPVVRAAGLRAALELWRGPALADVTATAPRRDFGDPLDRERLDALVLRVDAELAAGGHEELVPELWKATAEYPLREDFWRQLMLALYRSQRQAEALEAFHRATAVLREELGVAPSERLRGLHHAVLTNDPALAAPAPRPGWTPVCQLPPDIGDFVGRDRLAEALGDRLRRGRSVVLSGPPGVGKTALAVHVGHRLRPAFPDGQLHVNLHGYATEAALRPTDVLARFLRALGVAPSQIPAEQEQQAALLHATLRGRRVLLLLDNAASPDQVLPLLPTEPGCAALVTSRNELPGVGDSVPLAVLPHEDAIVLLSGILGDAEPAALDELATLCAHLPLALRIAAANLADLPGTDLAQQVRRIRTGDRLAALAIDGDRDAAVRAAFDRSYRALGPEQRRLFRLLGLVPGPDFTAASAAALAEEEPGHAAELLAGLAGANLVQRQEDGRFQLHDLLHLYAEFRCQSEESEGSRRSAFLRWTRHHLYGLDRATALLYPETARVSLPPVPPDARPPEFADLLEARLWLDAERPNLVAAVLRAADTGEDELAWLLADTLRGYLQHTRALNDWLTTASTGLAHAERRGHRYGQAVLHHGLGVLHWFLGQPGTALAHLEHARSGLAGDADRVRLANVVSNLGINHIERGQLTLGIACYREALEMLAELGDELRRVPSLGNLGIALRVQGLLADSREAYLEALGIARRIGLVNSEAVLYNNLGFVLWDMGELDEALACLDRGLASIRDLGGRYGDTNTVLGMAGVLLARGEVDQAEELARTGLAEAESAVDVKERSFAHWCLGDVLRARGELVAALAEHDRALTLARQAGLSLHEADALLGLAATHLAMGAVTLARTHAELARGIAAEVGYGVRLGQAHTALAGIELAAGNLTAARAHAETALASHLRTGHRPGEVRTRQVLADIAGAAEA